MGKRSLLVVLLLFVIAFSMVTFADDAAGCAACEVRDLVGTALTQQGFYRLLEAVVAAELVETLEAEGPFTLFAPSDEAFAALPEGQWEELLADPEALAQLLLYHVIPGRLSAADLVVWDGQSIASLAGPSLAITVDVTEVMVNGSGMTATNILASNGYIHVMDSVLFPSE